jgi:hypothetical protein
MTTQNTIPQGATLEAMIAALVADGYDVSFTEGFGAEPFGAHVEKSGDPDAGCTALGCTARDALAAALPEAVEEYLAAMTPAGLPAPGVADDIRTLSADMTDVFQRLDAVEARHDKFDRVEAALVWTIVDLIASGDPDGELAHRLAARRAAEKAAPAIDSEAWKCAKCGAQCIAGRPADDLCRQCAAGETPERTTSDSKV